MGFRWIGPRPSIASKAGPNAPHVRPAVTGMVCRVHIAPEKGRPTANHRRDAKTPIGRPLLPLGGGPRLAAHWEEALVPGGPQRVARAVLKRQACAPGPSRQQCQANDAKTMRHEMSNSSATEAMQSGARYGPNLLCNAVQRRSTLRNWGHAKEQALDHRTVIQQVTNALERQL